MKRELFSSERRYIQNILRAKTDKTIHEWGPVVVEYHAPVHTRRGVCFNNDYFLQFVPAGALTNFTSYWASVLPNTLGADIFITVDKETLRPLRTELIAGEAFSIKYFKEHIEKVEDALGRLSHRIQFHKCAYSRVFVIENDICFLAFPELPSPVMRGSRQLLAQDAEGSLAAYVDGTELVCVDGWIRTVVPGSELKLEAIAVDLGRN